MRFFLDENFPKKAEDFLISKGHDFLDIRGSSKEGIEDINIFNMAQENKAIFLTTDRDFFHTIPHIFPNHYGIVVIALRQPNRQAILSKLTWFIEHYQQSEIIGKAFLLRDNSFTIYPSE